MMLGNIMEEGLEVLWETEGLGVCCDVVSSVYGREAKYMKSQQYSYLNQTSTMTPVNMPMWMGEIPWNLTSRWLTTSN